MLNFFHTDATVAAGRKTSGVFGHRSSGRREQLPRSQCPGHDELCTEVRSLRKSDVHKIDRWVRERDDNTFGIYVSASDHKERCYKCQSGGEAQVSDYTSIDKFFNQFTNDKNQSNDSIRIIYPSIGPPKHSLDRSITWSAINQLEKAFIHSVSLSERLSSHY